MVYLLDNRSIVFSTANSSSSLGDPRSRSGKIQKLSSEISLEMNHSSDTL